MTTAHQLQYQFSTAEGENVTHMVTIPIEGEENVGPLNIPDTSVDLEIAFAVLMADIRSLYIVSDQDLTLETNDAGAPDDTLNLTAGKPIVWTTASGLTNPFTADVTALFASNSAGADASLIIKCGKDVTP